jgi:hypothetical protein
MHSPILAYSITIKKMDEFPKLATRKIKFTDLKEQKSYEFEATDREVYMMLKIGKFAPKDRRIGSDQGRSARAYKNGDSKIQQEPREII